MHKVRSVKNITLAVLLLASLIIIGYKLRAGHFDLNLEYVFIRWLVGIAFFANVGQKAVFEITKHKDGE